MTELTTIDPNNYGAMAKAMGIAGATVGTKTSNNLNRLRIWHSPIMGEEKVGNKLKKVEVKADSYEKAKEIYDEQYHELDWWVDEEYVDDYDIEEIE